MARWGLGKSKAVKKVDSINVSVNDYSLLLSPVITEKTSLLGGDKRRAVFKVNGDATKDQIKLAVERVFGVQVQSIRTCNFIGKVKRTARSTGRRPGYKKAYVTLKEGQSIDIVEGV